MSDAFKDKGYEIIEGLLDASMIELVSAAMDLSVRGGEMMQRNGGCVWSAQDEYSPMAGEMVLRHCRPAFEAVVGRELIETYAFWRVYREDAKLLKHKDRAACEISASVSIASDPEGDVWPFWLEDLGGESHEVILPPGSGIIYQGHNIAHWRDPFKGARQKQLLLHYVLKDGEFADHAFDQRDFDPVTGA